MIFDLDGTWFRTEKLKALSYLKAATALCPYKLDESEDIEAFKEVVRGSHQKVIVTGHLCLVFKDRPSGMETALAAGRVMIG